MEPTRKLGLEISLEQAAAAMALIKPILLKQERATHLRLPTLHAIKSQSRK